MKRLTTDIPQNNAETMLNYAYADDNEVVLRYGEHEDQRLCAYIAHRAKVLCDCEMSQEEIMEGSCFECVPDCALDVLNTVAIQAAELRERLKAMEDILGDDYDLDRLRELVEADREKRLLHLPKDGMLYCIEETEEEKWVSNKPIQDIVYKRGCGLASLECSFHDIGKTVFLTREDAEAALARMEST